MARKVVEKVKNAVLYDDGLIKIMNVRFSYPHLRKPYAGKKKRGDDQGEPKYGIVAMLDKKTHREAKRLIDARIDEILKEAKVKALAADKKFIRDGDEHENADYEGHWIVSARESRRPSLRDEDKEIVDPENADEVFYGGCYGSVLIRPWWQNNDFGKRVNAGLTAVRKSRDGEAFGEGRISDEEVDEAFDDDDDDDALASRSSSSRKGGSRYEDDDDDEKPRRRRRPADDEDPDDL